MISKKKKGRGMFVFICIATFIVAFGIGAISKIAVKPSWTKKYSVQMTNEIGKVYKDISYGDSEANKFDLYIPADGDRGKLWDCSTSPCRRICIG